MVRIGTISSTVLLLSSLTVKAEAAAEDLACIVHLL